MLPVKAATEYTITPVGENVLTINLGDSILLDTNKKVFQLYKRLLKDKHPSWLDIIPAYSTVSIVYDVLAIRQHHASAFQWMKAKVEKVMTETHSEEAAPTRLVQVPVCYDMAFALDSERLAAEKNISFDDFIDLHASRSYHVFMIGFLPGFAYMGSVDQRIVTPRMATPRIRIPAGSVGIAGEQTGIYPLDSPGGWNIIGRTPLKIFDSNVLEPVLLRPGDTVSFIPISKTEFENFNPSNFKFISDEF